MKSFKALFGLAVIAGVVYIGLQLIPPYFANFQFQDDVTTLARFASVDNRSSEDSIREDVMKKAKEHDIQLKPEQIRVVKDGRTAYIFVTYDVSVELAAGRSYTFHFEDASDNKAKDLLSNTK